MKKPILDFIYFILGVLFCFLTVGNVFAQDRHIAAGINHSLYLDPDGNVWAWGTARLPSEINRRIPHLVMQNGRSVSAISSEHLSYVIKQDGSLWGWGATDYGQMGIILLAQAILMAH